MLQYTLFIINVWKSGKLWSVLFLNSAGKMKGSHGIFRIAIICVFYQPNWYHVSNIIFLSIRWIRGSHSGIYDELLSSGIARSVSRKVDRLSEKNITSTFRTEYKAKQESGMKRDVRLRPCEFEDLCDMFLRNTGWLLPHYTVLYPRRYKFSCMAISDGFSEWKK
jgi:hypothetical protein